MFYQTSSKRSRPFWLLIAGARICVFLPNQRAAFLTCVTRKVHEVQPFTMLILAVRGDFIHEVKRLIQYQNKMQGERSQLICDYLTGKYAGLFAGITTIAYLEVCETIHRFIDIFWMQEDIYNFLLWDFLLSRVQYNIKFPCSRREFTTLSCPLKSFRNMITLQKKGKQQTTQATPYQRLDC